MPRKWVENRKMSIPDLINGCFELFAGFFILLHCKRLYKDKKARGVSLTAVIFFTLWGFWNLFYYPYLNQWLSFFGGMSIAIINSTWVVMLIYYICKEKNK